MVSAISIQRSSDDCIHTKQSTPKTKTHTCAPDADGRECVGFRYSVLMVNDRTGDEQLLTVTVQVDTFAEVMRAVDIERNTRNLKGYVTTESFQLKLYPCK